MNCNWPRSAARCSEAGTLCLVDSGLYYCLTHHSCVVKLRAWLCGEVDENFSAGNSENNSRKEVI